MNLLPSLTPQTSALMNAVHNLDCFDLLSRLPDGSIDAIISDPPYNTTALEWEQAIDWQRFWTEARRVLKNKRCPVILFSMQPFTTDLIVSNRKGFRYELIWHKTMPTGFLDANRRPLRDHENILIFADGMPEYVPQMEKVDDTAKWKRKRDVAKHYGTHRSNGWTGGNYHPRSVWTFAQERTTPDNNVIIYHNTQKPLALMRRLVLTYTTVNDVILDPFAGSGTTLVAAQELSRRFIGGDLSVMYCEVARKRLAMPYTLPLFASVGD